MVKSTSPTETMAKLALQTSPLLAGLEHVPSKDNPAGCLSRGGCEDPMVAARLATGAWAYDPPSIESLLHELDFDQLWGGGPRQAWTRTCTGRAVYRVRTHTAWCSAVEHRKGMTHTLPAINDITLTHTHMTQTPISGNMTSMDDRASRDLH